MHSLQSHGSRASLGITLALSVLYALVAAPVAQVAEAAEITHCVTETDADAKLALCTSALESADLSDADRAAALVARGEALIVLGQAQRALANLDAAIGLAPESAGAYRARAEAYRRLGKQVEAERDEAKAHSLDPSLAAGSQPAQTIAPEPVVAALVLDTSDLSAASAACAGAAIDVIDEVWRARIAQCTRVIESDAMPSSERAAALGMRGIAHVQLGDLDRGLADLGAAARLAPDMAFLHFGHGAALNEAGRHEAAIEALDRAIALDPRYALAYMQRGNAYAGQAYAFDPYELPPAARPLAERALKDYDKAIALNPALAPAYAARASLLVQLRQEDKARADAETAIRLEPRLGLAYFVRGMLKSRQDQDAAVADYDNAIRYDPTLDGAYVFRGLILLTRGEADRAIADFDAAIRINPQNGLAYHDRGVARIAKGEFAAAIPDFGKAITLRRNYASAHYYRAVAYARLGRPTEAQADLARVRAIDPGMIERRGDPLQDSAAAPASSSFAELAACGNAPDAARRISVCTRAIESGRLSDADLGVALVMRALGYVNSEPADPQRAIADTEAALRLDPANSYAYRTRGLAREELGDSDGAMADLDTAVRLDPEEPYHYLVRGMARIARGDRAGARDDLAKVKALDPEGAGIEATGFELMMNMFGAAQETQP
jgi:tetratricopeptide (TPR) repeat protein